MASDGMWAASSRRATPASVRHMSPWPTDRPSSIGIWLIAMTMPAPILNPVSTVSEMKCTIPPHRIAAANSAKSAIRKAVAVARSM
jgi:hypothetical protein